jgi:hypothetical protein
MVSMWIGVVVALAGMVVFREPVFGLLLAPLLVLGIVMCLFPEPWE